MPNLYTASKLASLDNLGSSKNDFDIEEQNSIVKRICGEFIKRVHNNIQTAGYNGGSLAATGKINNIELQEDGTTINITAPMHLVYQDMGVNGAKVKLYDTPFAYSNKMPPVEGIKNWIRLKGIQSKNNDHFHGEKTDIDEGAAFAIAKNIQKYGQKPKNVYSVELPELIADLSDALADFSVKEIFKNL